MLGNFVSVKQQQQQPPNNPPDNTSSAGLAGTAPTENGGRNPTTAAADEQQQQQKEATSNSNNAINTESTTKRQPPFSMPGVLHFLQHEWGRYELERAQWEMERSELKARISFLVGERKAQENLKHDLVRRIKMLEHVLKQERIKYQQLLEDHEAQNKTVHEEGDDADQQDSIPSHLKSNVPLDIDAIFPPSPKLTQNNPAGTNGIAGQTSSNQAWAQARETLRQYLQEIGYTERILDVRSYRVKHLLGILPPSTVDEQKGGNERKLSEAEKALLESEQAILEAADAIKSSRKGGDVQQHSQPQRKMTALRIDSGKGGGGSGGEEDDSSDSSADEHGTADVELDAEAVEAFSEFSFLKSEQSKSPKIKETLDEMKERFKSEQQRRRQHDQELLMNKGPFYMEDKKRFQMAPTQKPPQQQQQQPQQSSNNKRIISVDAVPGIPPTTMVHDAQPQLPLEDEKFADIKSGFEQDEDDESMQLRWNIRYTLRSHYDSIRAMQFHPVEPVLITASEDGTAKLWDLTHSSVGKSDAAGKSSQLPQPATGIVDMEPLYTFRGHKGPILALDMSPLGETCYTGGMDGKICCWSVPSTTAFDIYQSYDPSVLLERLVGHTDAIWSLCFHSASNRLISASADATIKIWIVGLADGAMPSPLLKTIQVEDGLRPRSIDLVSTAEQQLLGAYQGRKCNIRDLETGQIVVNFQMNENADDQFGQVNKIISHPTMPVSITAGDDRKIRFFDNNTGKLINATMAHVEGVSALTIDPNGLYLISGSHDGSLRLWNAEKRVCLQEIAAHRKKLGSGVMAVAFHPSRQLIGSAGADSLAKVYGPIQQSPRGSLIAYASPPSSSSGSSGPSSLVGSPQKSSPMKPQQQQSSQL